MSVRLIPATHRKREELDKQAVRLFAQVKPYTYASVRGYLLAEGLGMGADHTEANRYADEAMAYIRRRIEQIAAITIYDPDARINFWNYFHEATGANR
jgi:hypothetical protein